MNTYNNISSELKTYFSSNSIFKILLPIDMVFLFGGLIILALSYIFGINFGGLVGIIAYWAFILGLILTFANLHEQFLYIGLWSYAAIHLIVFLKILFTGGHNFSWYYLFYLVIYGGLGYLVFRHSVTGSSSNNGLNS